MESQNNSVIALREIQEMVLQHLNVGEREEAVLASRSFYETICYLERNGSLKLDYEVKPNK